MQQSSALAKQKHRPFDYPLFIVKFLISSSITKIFENKLYDKREREIN